jgi:hypothetical protein
MATATARGGCIKSAVAQITSPRMDTLLSGNHSSIQIHPRKCRMKFSPLNSWRTRQFHPRAQLFALCFYVLDVAIFTIYIEDANYAEFGLLGFMLVVERR